MLRQTRTYLEFIELSRALYVHDIEELSIGIEPDTPLGYFLMWSLPRLTAFCNDNPGFHIVSIIGSVKINTCVPGAPTYLLALGPADATLVHDPDGKICPEFYRSLYDGFNKRMPNWSRPA